MTGWSHDAQADFTWELNRGATQTNGTGPVTDHSTGDQGKFLVFGI